MKSYYLHSRAQCTITLCLLLSSFNGIAALSILNTSQAFGVALIISSLVELIIVLIARWSLKKYFLSIYKMQIMAQRINSGDLTQAYQLGATDELGTLTQELHGVKERMFKIISDVRVGTTTVAVTSGLIGSDNSALSERTDTQVALLEETASAIEELTSAIKDNTNNAMQANTLVMSASDQALKGGEVVGQVIQTMDAIKESSRRIVDITSMMEGLAFQTNILALNATVEAAHAGEQGRGFAVVAAEVRTLAKRSADAAKEIKWLIDDSVERVTAGSVLVDITGATMEKIVSSVQDVANILREISGASQEQSASTESINRAMIRLDGMTQQNACLVKDMKKTATVLHAQAVALTQVVADYNLGASEFGNAEDTLQLVKKAVSYARRNGIESLVREVNELSTGQFFDRDLYIIAIDLQGKIVAHGTNPRLVGVNAIKLRDSDGTTFATKMISLAKSSGMGWVDFKYSHPVTKLIMNKSAYVEKIGNVLIACGYYKDCLVPSH